MLEQLQGQLERVTFRNEENHFTIARMKVQGRRDLVTIVGTLASVSPGEILRLTGSWDRHPKYGEQFRFVSYEAAIPATAEGIRRYLGSGLIKGIGPVMAKRLVDRFGEQTLDVIEKEAHRLNEVEGIGARRIEMIRTAWEGQREVREVMLFLQGHGVSSGYAARIYRHYGKDSITVVRENPYRLATDIFGMGFITADKIASQLGMPEDAPVRAEAGVLYVLGRLTEEGNVFYPYEPLIGECNKILDLRREAITSAVAAVSAAGRIIIEDNASEGGQVYLTQSYACEKGIASCVGTIFGGRKGQVGGDADSEAAWAEAELGIALARNQRAALKAALREKMLIITGGPGTGKTTIIRAIIRVYRRYGRSVVLAAPTGRAAKRMSEACGHEAKTVHRLLEYSPQTGGFRRSPDNRLEADLVVLDESSMIDNSLMFSLLSAVPDSATVILVGDVDQLPSVGPGSVLKDMIGAGTIPTVRLDEIFRQSSAGSIILNSHRIIRGEFPIQPGPGRKKDFLFLQIEDPDAVRDEVLLLCREKIPSEFGLDPVDDIQVLAPMHRGVIGTSNLNAELQRCLNPAGAEIQRGGRTFRTGDKVMQVRNSYDRDVFNGDLGRIVSFDSEEQELVVNFDGRHVPYDFADLDELVTAYAISVHKSQGSEYPAVVIPLLTQHYLMLQRNLLYTAVTRGKRLVVIVGTSKALAIAIRNNKTQMRHTGLKQRLRLISDRLP